MTSIYDLLTKNENYTNIKNFQLDSHFDDELFLNHFLYPNDKRLDIATILFDKYTKNFPQEVHNIFMWNKQFLILYVNTIKDGEICLYIK